MSERELKNNIESEYYQSKSLQSLYSSRILNNGNQHSIEVYSKLLLNEKEKSDLLLKMLAKIDTHNVGQIFTELKGRRFI